MWFVGMLFCFAGGALMVDVPAAGVPLIIIGFFIMLKS